MGVNKNIEDLKKELASMHKLFDNILADKKEKISEGNKELDLKGSLSEQNVISEEERTISQEDEILKKSIKKESSISNNNNEEELSENNIISNIENITSLEEDNLIPENQDLSNNIEEFVQKEDIDDITLSFEPDLANTNKDSSKVIDLHSKEQYLSIREKLEKIKNEIKQKELELKKKKK